jgi:hypothetical protein
VTQWQPIGTAPKDGTWIVVGGGAVQEYHAEGRGPPIAIVQWWASGWLVTPFDSACAAVYYEDPAVWAVLPELPPLSQGGEA